MRAKLSTHRRRCGLRASARSESVWTQHATVRPRPGGDMNGGGVVLPPVPDLIPIAALRKPSVEVMGERRRPNHAELIDSIASPPQPHGGPPRRRQHRRRKASRRRRKQAKLLRKKTPPPRVNPIFVWTKIEDNQILDVQCEDYDKRNRILLTKTSRGWIAIPRTENSRVAKPGVTDNIHYAYYIHNINNNNNSEDNNTNTRKITKNKTTLNNTDTSGPFLYYKRKNVPRRTASVQVTSDIEAEDLEPPQEEPKPQPQEPKTSPLWISTDNVNIESLLPSHTIEVKRPLSRPEENESPIASTSANALDNLLAVAELEFNQQEWDRREEADMHDDEDVGDEDATSCDNEMPVEEQIELIEELDQLIEKKSEECDYNEDDDHNHIAMDDILTRLEQSLQSPEKNEEAKIPEDCISEKDTPQNVPDETELYFEKSDPEAEAPEESIVPVVEDSEQLNDAEEQDDVISLADSSYLDEEEIDEEIQEAPTDLSVKTTTYIEDISDDQPEDLSIPKGSAKSTPRPPSQNSEAIQSPQPSGIPAVPPSPDIVTTTSHVPNKLKSVFLENLLSTTSKHMMLNSEVSITRQKEPLDLGASHRKSASPTVTCSEEIHSATEMEPPSKKFKPADITLRNLLDTEDTRNSEAKIPGSETPRLLELLKNDTQPDPLTQLKQLIADPSITIPDPMLVPKEKFSIILTKPGTEIPKLLSERPELRLPDALAYPHIMQDPNMLVLNVDHLIQILSNKNAQCYNEAPKKGVSTQNQKKSEASRRKIYNDLAQEIDSATKAAFNHMFWLPCINTEGMSQINNPEVIKALSDFPAFYQNQMTELSHLYQCPPVPYPVQPPPVNYGNPMEVRLWQEAMLQAHMLKNRNNSMDNKLARDNLGKMHSPQSRKQLPPNPQPHPQSRRPSVSTSGLFPNPISPFPNANSGVFPPKPTIQSPMLRHPSYQPRGTYGSQRHNSVQHQHRRETPPFRSKVFSPEQYYMKNLVGFSDLQKSSKPKEQPHRQKPGPKTATSGHQKTNENLHRTKTSTSVIPMDLSGSTTPPGKVKGRSASTDSSGGRTSKHHQHHEDVPEVGSTTASIEEIQDAHKHLWHPLFGK